MFVSSTGLLVRMKSSANSAALRSDASIPTTPSHSGSYIISASMYGMGSKSAQRLGMTAVAVS